MLFIMGINQKSKPISNQESDILICPSCSRYGRVELFKTYTSLSIFFIPILSWGQKYYASMSCCNTISEISIDSINSIISGNINQEEVDIIFKNIIRQRLNYCEYCNFSTSDDFEYCPKCGKPLIRS